MLARYVRRGLTAGLVAGFVFGVFVVLVGNPLVEVVEGAAHGHGDAADGAHSLGSLALSNAVSVGGGVFWGVLAGVVTFGIVYYFLEPVVPGRSDTQSYLLAGAGFVTASGAPWLVLPPQSAGVAQGLPVDVRIRWYVAMMVVGAVVCALSGYAYNRVARTNGRAAALVSAALPFALLAIPLAIAPANPVDGTGSDLLVASFRGFVVFGQLALWFVLASAHAWLVRRDRTDDRLQQIEETDQPGSVSAN